MDQACKIIVFLEDSVGNTAIFISNLGAPVERIEVEVKGAPGVAVFFELVSDVLAVRSPLLKDAAGGIRELEFWLIDATACSG